MPSQLETQAIENWNSNRISIAS